MTAANTPKTPLAIIPLPRKIGDMTDDERHAFARVIFEAIAKARRPA